MRNGANKVLSFWAWFSALAVFGINAGILVFLVMGAGKFLSWEFFFGSSSALGAILGRQPVFDGLWPSLVGTLQLVAGASLLALPIGILAGIYLSEYGKASGWSRFLRGLVDVLAGIPSIIMGLFGFGLILFLRHTFLPDANTSLILAMFCLALLVLPYLVRSTESALRSIPPEVRLTGPALGLNQNQNLRWILLPAARPHLISGVLLTIGRIAEDTAVILMTGAVANSGLSGRLTGKFQALPFDIYYLAAEHQGPEDLQRAFATSLILLFITVSLLMGAKLVTRFWAHQEGIKL